MDTEYAAEVADLLNQMTVEEKIAQLSAYMFFDTYWFKHDMTDEQERIDFICSVKPKEMMGPEGLGFITTKLRDLPPRVAAEVANQDQTYIRDHTRLGIPALVHDEGLHGLIGRDATIYPSAIGMAASWNVELFSELAHTIGRESKVRGVRQLLSPTVNLGIDPRCGRTEETYGESPLMASRFGAAYVSAVQSEGVVCTPKHFVANFEADAGRDSWAAHFTERMMREMFFPPFEACVKAGALSLMNAYNSIDGIPCVANKWLLTDVLRDEWGFEGYVVSDYVSVILQMKVHKTAETEGIAAKKALEAGMDIELPRFECFGKPLHEMVEKGDVSMETIDQAVARVLSVKKKIGVFEDRLVDPDEAERVTNCEEHRKLARRMAQQSIVVLKNENALLPLKGKRIAVIGPNADTVELGDYTYDKFKPGRIPTPLDGMRQEAPEGVAIQFAKGCNLAEADEAMLAEAVDAARSSDVAVVVVGSSVKLEGEARDRSSIDLRKAQEDLILAVADTGTPVVVVVITGSVHTMSNWIDRVDGVVQGWYLGEAGGGALADILYGVVNPSGKLPITIPRHLGQCPIYHYHKPSGRAHAYDELGQQGTVLYPFGHGLSYTQFDYSDLRLSAEEIRPDGELTVSCKVKNTGSIAGVEIVQLYIHDVFACVARPRMELKDFARISLKAGEEREVEFTLHGSDLAFLNEEMKWIVEPGEMEVMIGRSCSDIPLRGKFAIK